MNTTPMWTSYFALMAASFCSSWLRIAASMLMPGATDTSACAEGADAAGALPPLICPATDAAAVEAMAKTNTAQTTMRKN